MWPIGSVVSAAGAGAGTIGSFDAASAGYAAARSDGYAMGLILSSSAALFAVLASWCLQKVARSNRHGCYWIPVRVVESYRMPCV